MYRLGFTILTILAVVLGLLTGTLNHEVVTIDLLWFQLRWPLGLALICALALGVMLGFALCWLFSVLPLRLRLRKARRGQASETDLLARPHD